MSLIGLIQLILKNKASHIVVFCTMAFSGIITLSMPYLAKMVSVEMVQKMDERYLSKFEYWAIQSVVDRDKILSGKKTPHPEHLNGEITFCKGTYGRLGARLSSVCSSVNTYRTNLLLK